MAYQSLEKLFHMDASSKRFENNVALAASRREAESSFKTSFDIGGEELFLATPRELSLLNETILGREREIAVALSDLPAIARGALIRAARSLRPRLTLMAPSARRKRRISPAILGTA